MLHSERQVDVFKRAERARLDSQEAGELAAAILTIVPLTADGAKAFFQALPEDQARQLLWSEYVFITKMLAEFNLYET